MSLHSTISAEETHRGIAVTETTGAYSVDNTTGYGVKNITKSMISKAYLDISRGTQKYFIDLYPTFPSDDKCLAYEVLSSQLGGAKECAPSGKYIVKYTIEGVDGDGLKFKHVAETVLVLVNCIADCVDKAMKQTATVNVNMFTKDDKKKQAIEMAVLMNNVCWAIEECGLFDYADDIIKYIDSQICSCCS